MPAELEIRIFDSLVDNALVDSIYESVNVPVYGFGERSNPGDLFGFWIAKITDEVFNSVKPFSMLWKTIDEHVTKGTLEIYRMYVNANSFGDCPTVHTDVPRESEGFLTVIYYANPKWNHNWAGETVFYNEQRSDIVKSVYPRPGRVVIFDSRIPHVARMPTRSCPHLRYTIAIKLRPRSEGQAA